MSPKLPRKAQSADERPPPTQSERFMQVARELECDDDPERFKDRVRNVARQNTEQRTKVNSKT